MRNDSINTFSDFLTSFNGYRKKRKIVKDEKKLRGALDKSSSEQHFRKSDMITFVVWKFWSHTPSASGCYGSLAGQQSDEIREDLESSTDRIVRNFTAFYEGTVLL